MSRILTTAKPKNKPFEFPPAIYWDVMTLEALFYRSVEEFEMTVNLANCLGSAGIRTIGELAMKTKEEIEALAYVPEGEKEPVPIHKKGLKEVEKILKGFEIGLGLQVPPDVFETLRKDAERLREQRTRLQSRYEELRSQLPRRTERTPSPLVLELNRKVVESVQEAPAPPTETLPQLRSSIQYWEGKVASMEKRLGQS
jgi:hypothetical protein